VHHEHAWAPSAEAVKSCGPCDCQHVLISQAPTLTASRQSVLDAQQVAHASLAVLPMAASAHLAAAAELVLAPSPHRALPPQLRALSSVVLRC
jgi:hypothetical protein